MPDPTDASPIDAVRPLLRTHQVREHTPEPLTDDELFAITEVARWSGSSSNDQPWRFIVDPRARRRSIGSRRSACRRPGRSRRPPRPSSWPCRPRRTGRSRMPSTTAAPRSGCSSRPRCSASAGPSRGSARTSATRPARSSASPTTGWSGPWWRSGIPTAAAARPKTTHGEARRPRDETVFEERWPSSDGVDVYTIEPMPARWLTRRPRPRRRPARCSSTRSRCSGPG